MANKIVNTGTTYQAGVKIPWSKAWATDDMVCGVFRDEGFERVRMVSRDGRSCVLEGQWNKASTTLQYDPDLILWITP